MSEPDEPPTEPQPDSESATEPQPPKPNSSARRARLEIPGYHIQGVIGRGSTGTVYRARQENVDRVVALKVLHKELSSRPRMVGRLQREARTTARLAHPHIVTAIDMGRTGDRWWFAMELVDGPSLALKLRQEGRLSERDALRFFIPLCEALVHIWENGVVHRDIKPANILIDRVSGARLADLGLAFADDDPHLTGSEGTLGTPHYISPEQARDPSSVDTRTDIWSFGATLFHAVCGEPPLRGENVAEVLSGVLYGRVPDPVELEPDLSRGLSLVLRKCLSRDFERRYQTPRELLRDLERVRERRKPKVRAASLEPTSGERGHGLRAGIALGLFVLVVGGGGLLWKRPWERVAEPDEVSPLVLLVERLDRGAEPPGLLLGELESVRPELPASELKAWRSALATARGELERTLNGIQSESESRFESLLAKGDFSGAKAVIGPELERSLIERAGVSLATAPSEFSLGVVFMGNRLERSVGNETTRLRGLLETGFGDPFLTKVEGFASGGLWRDAAEHVGISADELALQLGIDLSSLPEERRGQLIDFLSAKLGGARLDLNRRWAMLDEELVRWIEFAARDLANELSETLEPVNAGARLRDGFEGELRRQGTAREELLSDPFGLARPYLTDEAAALEEYERRLVGGRDTSDSEAFDSLAAWLDESVAGEAFRDRRYEEVEAYWLERAEWLDGNESAAPWWAELKGRVEARLAEVRLLLDLRNRAEAAIVLLDGTETELHMSADVGAPGVLHVQAPGAVGGLHFVVGLGAEYELYITAPKAGLPRGARLLQAVDLERLGSGSLDPATADLTRGVFRFREGDLDGAYGVLQGVDPMAPWAEIAKEHLRGIERGQSVMALNLSRRLAQARSLMGTLYFDEADQLQSLERDPGRALSAIDRLLGDFGDLDPIVVREADLKVLAQRLRAPGIESDAAAFDKAFGVGITHFPAVGKAELFYDFAGVEVPGFSRGDWIPDGAGWLSPGSIADDDQLLGHPAPRLVLRSPLKLDSGLAVCEFEFEEPKSIGPERLVLVSVAGFDFAVRTDKNGKESVVIAGVRGAEQLLSDLRSGAGEKRSSGLLVAGKTHLLRLEFEKRRGRLLVILDGVPVLQRDTGATNGRSGSYGVSLRAREQIRLLSVRVVAGR